MSSEFLLYLVTGFVAQLIDGTLGMAYGISAMTLLMFVGVPPASASATVHVAECFTTGASAVSHHVFGNVSRLLFVRLVIPGVIGAILGAWLLARFAADAAKPLIAAYLLLMGVIIGIKAFREFPPRTVTTHLAPLGFIGAFLDSFGGGGWGPIVASNLIVRGNDPRFAVGSVIAAEFFVTLAASITFLATLGISNWPIIAGLALGGLVAAPIGAWAVKRLPTKPFLILVSALIILLSLVNFWRHYSAG